MNHTHTNTHKPGLGTHFLATKLAGDNTVWTCRSFLALCSLVSASQSHTYRLGWLGFDVKVYVRNRVMFYFFPCFFPCFLVCLFVCLSVCLFVCLSVLSVCLFVCFMSFLASFLVCLFVCLSVCLFVCLSVCLFVCFLASFLVCLFVCLSVCLFVCLSVCLSVCLFVCLSVCLFVCLFVCLSVCLFVCLFRFCGTCAQKNNFGHHHWFFFKITVITVAQVLANDPVIRGSLPICDFVFTKPDVSGKCWKLNWRLWMRMPAICLAPLLAMPFPKPLGRLGFLKTSQVPEKPGWIHDMTAFFWWSKMVQISRVLTKRTKGYWFGHWIFGLAHAKSFSQHHHTSFIFPKIWPKTDFLESQFQVQSQSTSGCASGDYWIIAGLFEVYRFIKSWC